MSLVSSKASQRGRLIFMKDKAASLIRTISIPPVMITVLIIILYITRPDIFDNIFEVILTILFLGFFPVLAYPAQNCFPKYRDAGRDGQRKLAFIFTLIGYTGAFLWSLITGVHTSLLLITTTYFLSVVVLTLINKVIHFKASGHACSFTSPAIFLTYFSGWKWGIICIIFAALIWWSSVYLKRHTNKQLVGGMMTCLAAFGMSYAILI